MIIDYHSLFFFFGTLQGELFKKAFGFFLFTLISYMIFSEYIKNPRKYLKYLIIAFSAFSFQKLLSTVILIGVLFGDLGRTTFHFYLPIITHALEVFGLIFLANGFLYPFYKKISLRPNIMFQISLLNITFIIFGALALWRFIFHENGRDIVFYSDMIFSLMKLTLLIYPIYILHNNKSIKYKHKYEVMIGFFLYAITPLLLFVNHFLFDGGSQRLLVASHPFPLLAALQFTRIIYLRLVDKAYLISRLKISEQKYKQEKEINKMKDSFLSTVTHELKTPLTSIRLYNDLIKKNKFGKVSKKQKDALDVIDTESLRLSELITDILDLSKLESGKVPLKLSTFDISIFMKSNPYYKMAEQKKLKLVNKTKSKYVMRADEDKIKRAMINLITNSIKYTDKGRIKIEAKNTKNYHELCVSDTGKGMSKEQQEKVFDKFYQVDHSFTRQDKGTGLGLAIVNEIIKLHKGSIKVDSKIGRGTKITLLIPKDL